MTQLSDYLENALINHVLRGTAGATNMIQPPVVYISLHTANPNDDATGAEFTGGSYQRQTIDFDEPISGAATNSGTVIFTGLPTGTLLYLGIWDSEEGGNLLMYSNLIEGGGILLNTNDEITIAPGSITVSFD